MNLTVFKTIILLITLFLIPSLKSNAQSADFYRLAAEKGYDYAQNNLGTCFKTGNGVAVNYELAVHWYRKAAEKGLSEAQFNLAVCYAEGKGVKKDINQAIVWCSKAAEQFYASAYYNLGVYYEEINEYVYAAFWYRKAVDAKQPMAQYNLGVYLERGIYVQKNETEAYYLFLNAAKAGIVEAQYRVALCYYYRKGVPQRYSQAAYWFRKAAEKGHKESQYQLGVCYLEGNGVKKNPLFAFYWFDKGAKQGESKSLLRSGFCFQYGIGTDTNLEKAFSCYKEAALKNDIEALNQVGYCYLNGIGVTKDQFQALSCWNKVILDTTASESATRYAKIMKGLVLNNEKNALTELTAELNHSYLTVDKPKKHFLANSIGTYSDNEKYGIHIGFQNKQWVHTNATSTMKYGYWTDSDLLYGYRTGVNYQSQLGNGFALSTGLFYEYYYSKSPDHYTTSLENSILNEHSVNIPANLQFRLHLKPRLSCFIYSGLSIDYGLFASVKIVERGTNLIKQKTTNVYNANEWGNKKRFNASIDFGGGIRAGNVQLNAGVNRGIINQSDNAGLHIYQNNNLILSMSVWF